MRATADGSPQWSATLLAGGTLLLALVACGPRAPPPDRPPDAPPARTVFDDLTSKERELPAAVGEAQRQHADAQRRALEAAEGGDRGEPAR